MADKAIVQKSAEMTISQQASTASATSSSSIASSTLPIAPVLSPPLSPSHASSSVDPQLSAAAIQLFANADAQKRGFLAEDEAFTALCQVFPKVNRSEILKLTKEVMQKEQRKMNKLIFKLGTPVFQSVDPAANLTVVMSPLAAGSRSISATSMTSASPAVSSNAPTPLIGSRQVSAENIPNLPIASATSSAAPSIAASPVTPSAPPAPSPTERLSEHYFCKLYAKVNQLDRASAEHQTVVLITSCMQNDFFHRFPRRRDSMNRYWVGRKDSERVLGFDPSKGPFSQLMNFIRTRSVQLQQLQSSYQNSSSSSSLSSQSMLKQKSTIATFPFVDISGTPLSVSDPNTNPSPSPSEDEAAGQVGDGGHDPDDVDPQDDEFNHEIEETEEDGITPSEVSVLDDNRQLNRLPQTPLRIDLQSSAISSVMQTPGNSSSFLTPQMVGLSTLSPLILPQRQLSSAINAGPVDSMLLPSSSFPSGTAASSRAASAAATPAAPFMNMNSTTAAMSAAFLTPIHVIHLRASIDRAKERGRSVIERFGEYCLSGTEGARLCAGLEDNIDKFPNESIIDTTRLLSSNSYRPLLKKLREIHGNSAGPLRVAVIGGWTDEDVYHLCYELKTRTKAIDIATCSVLTASPSTSQHWNALGQMKRVMGVTVTRTVRELVQWFGVTPNTSGALLQPNPNADKYLTGTASYWPTFIWHVNGAATTTAPKEFRPESDGEILAHLYRNSSKILIDILVGDFSRAVVLSIRSYDKSQVREAPSVLKIARAEDIATEYQAFHRVEEMLGNNAPMVRGFVELGTRAGIKFRYTRMTGGKVTSMADLFNDLATQTPVIGAALDEVFEEIFNPWYAGARLEFFDLFAYYFDGYTLSLGRAWDRVKKVDRVHCDSKYLQQFITYVLAKKGTDPAPFFKQDKDFYGYEPYSKPTFVFPMCEPLTNLGLLFEKPSGVPYLRTLPPQKLYACFSHGNATLENFMCEGTTSSSSTANNGSGLRGNVWIVDFYYTEARNHCLRDLARTWCCIMYSAAEINNDHQFKQAILITQEIVKARDMAVPLNAHIPGLTDIHLKTIYTLLLNLWKHAGRIVKERSSASQFQMALLADSMRFFLYRAKNIYSKRWALSSSVMLLESILLQEKRIHDIKPSWIPLSEQNTLASKVKGKLGITRCPGNRDFIRFEKKQPLVVQTPHLAVNLAAAGMVSTAAMHTTDPNSANAISQHASLASSPTLPTAAVNRLLSARYSATNPSLLPPNEDPRRAEALEREQAIREQKEQEDRDEAEEERRQSITGHSGDLSIALNNGKGISPTLDPSPSPQSAATNSSTSSDPAGIPVLPGPTTKKQRKLEAEEARAKDHARVLMEQEQEAVRYAQQKQAMLKSANSQTDLASHAQEAPEKEVEEEIEEEMAAAAEVERLREEASNKFRARGKMHAISNSTSSCDLSFPLFQANNSMIGASNPTQGALHLHQSQAQANNASLGSQSKNGSTLAAPTLTPSFSSPHLSELVKQSSPLSLGGSLGSRGGLNHVDATELSSGQRLSRIQREVSKLAREGVTHILLLLSDSDFKEMGVDKVALHAAILEQRMKQLRIVVPSGPLPLPLLIDVVQVCMSVLCDTTAENKLILISKSGFHRAGTLAACILCAFGLPVERAVRIVRDARGSRSLGRESRDQLVAKFDVEFKKYLINKVLHSGELFQHSMPSSTNKTFTPGQLETPAGNRASFTLWPVKPAQENSVIHHAPPISSVSISGAPIVVSAVSAAPGTLPSNTPAVPPPST